MMLLKNDLTGESFNRKATLARIYSKYGMFFILVVIVLVSCLLDSVFLTPLNLSNVFRNMSIVSLVAFGMTFLLILGMIDLSSGSVMALSGCLACIVVRDTGSVALAILVGVATGFICGVINGAVIVRFRIPAFIMTLAMQTVARGTILMVTDGTPVRDMGDKFKLIGQGDIFGIIPIPVIIMLAGLLLCWILLNRTRFGRHVIAVGGNEVSARASGINVNKTIFLAYLMNGLFVGFAGVMFMARLNSGQPAGATNYELDAITAAVVGGTSMSGGSGSVMGTFIGGLIIAILNNMMNLQGLNSNWQMIVKGIIIAVSVIVDFKTKQLLANKKN